MMARGANLLAGCNPGFEDGLKGWTPTPVISAMFQVLPEAASMGKEGLRAGGTGDLANTAASLTSTPVPVTPGHSYRLTFWAGSHLVAYNANANLVFYDQNGAPVPSIRPHGYWSGSILNQSDGNEPFLFEAIAPPQAVRAGVVLSVIPQTKGYTDIDDFDLEDVPPDPPGAKADHLPAIDVAPLIAEAKADPYRGKAPPKIVIKIDDLTATARDKWQRVLDFAAQRHIKVNIGIIARSLPGGPPDYLNWIKKIHDTGMVEFWFHGWDHQNWTSPDGKSHGEFNDRSYAEQKKRFDDAEQAAKQELGFPFTSFGAPSNSWDDTTMKVLQDEPDITNFMYPAPGHTGGKIPLYRVGGVNIEYPTFFPRYDRFVAGYVHNRGRDYFVIQGHPWHWNDRDYGEFVKIIDFLSDQGARFVSPTELSLDLAAESKPSQPASLPAP